MTGVLQALVLEREQHPPRVRTATTPVNVDRHSYIRLKCSRDCNGNGTAPKMQEMKEPMYTTLIEPAELAAPLTHATMEWAIVDCRFDLARSEWGQAAYATGHVPDALYAHLDHDLSGPIS